MPRSRPDLGGSKVVKIDLKNWRPIDNDQAKLVEVEDHIYHAPEEVPAVPEKEEFPKNDLLEVRAFEPDKVVFKPGAMKELFYPEPDPNDQEEIEDDVPVAEVIIPYPVMLVTAQAVVNENGKGKAEVYELDLKMRVPAADLSYILTKIEGHKSAVIFRPLSEVV